MRGKPVGASRVVLSRVVHPNEASFMGTAHGGVILHLIDEAGGMAAGRELRPTPRTLPPGWTASHLCCYDG